MLKGSCLNEGILFDVCMVDRYKNFNHATLFMYLVKKTRCGHALFAAGVFCLACEPLLMICDRFCEFIVA